MDARMRAVRCMVASLAIAALVTVGVPAVTWGYGVSFDQVDWLDGAGGFTAQDSDWGTVSIQLSAADAGSFATMGSELHGYVNVVTTVSGGAANNWAVQNKLLYFGDASELDGRLPEMMTFDLGVTSGSDVTALDYMVTIDATARPSAPTGTMTSGSVGTSEWLFGGLADPGVPFSGNTSQAAPPEAQNYEGAAAGDLPHVRGIIDGEENEVPAVDEELSGCAPAAAARSLKYLDARNDHFDVPGTVQDIYDELKSGDYMKTDLGKDGGGTRIDDFLAAKTKYARDKGLSLVTRETWDIMKVVDALNDGADVEIGVYWGTNAAGKSKGGHCAFVSAITVARNADGEMTGFEVKIIDDQEQGDDVASNRAWWLSFEANGNLKNQGAGAKLNSFRVETIIPEPAGLGLIGLVMLGLRTRRN